MGKAILRMTNVYDEYLIKDTLTIAGVSFTMSQVSRGAVSGTEDMVKSTAIKSWARRSPWRTLFGRPLVFVRPMWCNMPSTFHTEQHVALCWRR